MPEVDNVLERLGREGHRLTGPRRAVLEEVLNRSVPFTSSELLDTMAARCPGIGRATVFRTLELLVSIGVVQRIHSDASGGRCHAYLACEERHHHHLICNRCGVVMDFTEGKEFEALMREIESRTSFQIEAHRLELVGCCPACQDTSAEAGGDYEH